MDSIKIEGTPKTPTVSFDAKTGQIEIKGRSIPENSIEFYKPLVDWLDKYADIAEGTVEVTIQLEYFNTSSSKCILDVFKKLENLNNKSKADVVIRKMTRICWRQEKIISQF